MKVVAIATPKFDLTDPDSISIEVTSTQAAMEKNSIVSMVKKMLGNLFRWLHLLAANTKV